MDRFRSLFSSQLVPKSECALLPQVLIVVRKDYTSECYTREIFLQKETTRYDQASLDLVKYYPQYSVFQEYRVHEDGKVYGLRPLQVSLDEYLRGMVSKKMIVPVQKVPLGAGAFGEVYSMGDSPVATKKIKKVSSNTLLETCILQVLQQSECCVVKTYGVRFDQVKKTTQITMPRYLRSLSKCECEGKELEIFYQLAKGLYYGYSCGVIHTDVKPANFLLGPEGAVISDWGLANYFPYYQNEPRRGGTPSYTPLEVLKDAPYTSSVDVFALGLSIYEFYTGKRAFSEVPQQPVQGKIDWKIYPKGIRELAYLYGVSDNEAKFREFYWWEPCIPPSFFELPYHLAKLLAQMCCSPPGLRPTYAEILNHSLFSHLRERPFPEIYYVQVLDQMPTLVVKKKLTPVAVQEKAAVLSWVMEILTERLPCLITFYLVGSLLHYGMATTQHPAKLLTAASLYLILSAFPDNYQLETAARDFGYPSTQIFEVVQELITSTNFRVHPVVPLLYFPRKQRTTELGRALFAYCLAAEQPFTPREVAEYISFTQKIPILNHEVTFRAPPKSEAIRAVLMSVPVELVIKHRGLSVFTHQQAYPMVEMRSQTSFTGIFLSAWEKHFRNNLGDRPAPKMNLEELREFVKVPLTLERANLLRDILTTSKIAIPEEYYQLVHDFLTDNVSLTS